MQIKLPKLKNRNPLAMHGRRRHSGPMKDKRQPIDFNKEMKEERHNYYDITYECELEAFEW